MLQAHRCYRLCPSWQLRFAYLNVDSASTPPHHPSSTFKASRSNHWLGHQSDRCVIVIFWSGSVSLMFVDQLETLHRALNSSFSIHGLYLQVCSRLFFPCQYLLLIKYYWLSLTWKLLSQLLIEPPGAPILSFSFFQAPSTLTLSF